MDYIAVGNEELTHRPTVKKGDLITCKNCNEKHPLEYGVDSKTKQESDALGFTKCGETTFLVSIRGKLLK